MQRIIHKITFLSILSFILMPLSVQAQRATPFHNQALKPSGISAEPYYKFDDAPLQFRHYAKPGELIEGKILAHNNTDTEIEFHFAAVDEGFNEKQNQKYFRLENEEKTGISKYFFFPEKKVTVPPQFSIIVPYQVRIPENFAEGEYRSGISVLKKGKPQKGAPVVANMRVILSNTTYISKNPMPPKNFAWRNFPPLSIYLTASVLLVFFYNTYLFADKKNRKNIA